VCAHGWWLIAKFSGVFDKSLVKHTECRICGKVLGSVITGLRNNVIFIIAIILFSNSHELPIIKLKFV